MGLTRFIKRIFGKYETGFEYWVRLSDIKIPESFKRTKIGEQKWKRKLHYWLETGKFESKIMLDKDFNLLDGYSSVKIAQSYNLDKVPVYFYFKNDKE